MKFVKTLVAVCLFFASPSGFATDITGAASSFIYRVLSKWADAYEKESSNRLNYQSM